MAKIKKFEFKNVRSYGNKMVEIPFDMDNGLVLIQGKNGGGKTSIVEALEFSIFGNSSRVPVKNLPNWFNDNAYTNVWFETDDNRAVKLARGISPDFYDLKIGENSFTSKGKSENKSGKPKIDKMVEEELYGISQDIFANNILLSINEFKSFIKMKPADKRKIIDKIFDTYEFNEMLKKVKNELSVLRTEKTELTTSIESKQNTLDATMTRINEIKATISDDIDSVITKYQAKIIEIEGKLKTANVEFSDLRLKLDGKSSELQREQQNHNYLIQNIMSEYNSDCEKIRAVYESEVSEFRGKERMDAQGLISQIEEEKNKRISELSNPESVISTKASEIYKKLEELGKLVEGRKASLDAKKIEVLSEISKKYSAKKEVITSEHTDKKTRLKGKYDELVALRNELSQRLIDANNIISEINGNLLVYKNKLSLYNNNQCPECGSDLHDEFHTEKRQGIESEINRLEIKLGTCLEQKIEIENSLNANELSRQSATSLDSNIDAEYNQKMNIVNMEEVSEINVASSDYSTEYTKLISSADAKRNQLNSDIENIRETVTVEYNNNYSSISNVYNSKINEVRTSSQKKIDDFSTLKCSEYENKISNEKISYDSKITAENSRMLKLEAELVPVIEELKKDKELCENTCKSLTEEINGAKLNLATVQNGDATKTITELSSIVSELEYQINEIKPILEICEEKIEIRENTQHLIGEDGLKKMIMRKILPRFNASIQKITSMFDFKYRFMFDDNFDAHLSYCGKEVPITISKGEEKIMDIIVLLSTLQIILMKHPSINMLFLDEIFSNLDVENIAKSVEILKGYSMNYKLIVFVMSHTAVPSELFDKIINVSYDGTFSSLEIN